LKIFVVFLIAIMAALSVSCANILEGYVESVAAHESTPYDKEPEQQIAVSDMEELETVLLSLIMSRETEVTLLYYGPEEDVQAEILDRSAHLMQNHPVAAYAVTRISAQAARIVAYFEVELEIEYKRTAEQIASIINVSTMRYMTTQLLDIMSDYKEEAAILTNLRIDKDDIIGLIAEIYYNNPRRIIMMPFVTVETYPPDGANRIYEIKFGYTEEADMQREYTSSLDLYVSQNAERAVGDTDAEILLSLVENIIASTTYDEGAAGAISMHGPQNFTATAFGALITGNAVGEGFAMAFKALCDELQFDCRVVLGQMDGKVHAWNIVALEGYYYHIDTAIAALYGLEAGFLKNDEDILDTYIWDTEKNPRCSGTLTLDDVRPPEDPEDPNDPSDPNDPNNPNDPNDPNNPSDPSDPNDPSDPTDHSTPPPEPNPGDVTPAPGDQNGDNTNNG